MKKIFLTTVIALELLVISKYSTINPNVQAEGSQDFKIVKFKSNSEELDDRITQEYPKCDICPEYSEKLK